MAALGLSWVLQSSWPVPERAYVSECDGKTNRKRVLAVQVDGSSMQVALQWCSDSFSDHLVGFVNNVKTVDGGTHMDGLKAALTRTVNTLARYQPA